MLRHPWIICGALVIVGIGFYVYSYFSHTYLARDEFTPPGAVRVFRGGSISRWWEPMILTESQFWKFRSIDFSTETDPMEGGFPLHLAPW